MGSFVKATSGQQSPWTRPLAANTQGQGWKDCEFWAGATAHQWVTGGPCLVCPAETPESDTSERMDMACWEVTLSSKSCEGLRQGQTLLKTSNTVCTDL